MPVEAPPLVCLIREAQQAKPWLCLHAIPGLKTLLQEPHASWSGQC